MEAVEFSTQIQQGIIHLPKELTAFDNRTVRIIILVEKPVPSPSQKERLREVLLRMANSKLFSKISDPVQWQKDVRNEWE